jgi:hypothetical protein
LGFFNFVKTESRFFCAVSPHPPFPNLNYIPSMCFFVVLGIEPRAQFMLGKHCTTSTVPLNYISSYPPPGISVTVHVHWMNLPMNDKEACLSSWHLRSCKERVETGKSQNTTGVILGTR